MDKKRELPVSLTTPVPKKSKAEVKAETSAQIRKRKDDKKREKKERKRQQAILERAHKQHIRDIRAERLNERAQRGQEAINLSMDENENYASAMRRAEQQARAENGNGRYREILRNIVEEDKNRIKGEKARRNWRKKLPVGLLAGPVYRRAQESANNPDRLAELGLFEDPEARARYFQPATAFGRKNLKSVHTIINYLMSL